MWLLAALATSAALVLGGPVVGQIRSELRAYGGDWSTAILTMVWVLAAIAVALAALQAVRLQNRAATHELPLHDGPTHYRQRYAALSAAFCIAVGYGWLMRTGNAEVDAVERFHFLQYGVITFLFYMARRRVRDRSAFVVPLVAAFVVGTLEEWFQWFVPGRVGEMRDVLLNLVAITCGMLCCAAIAPPTRPFAALSPTSRRQMAVTISGALVIFGAFFHSVHLGYEITDREAGVFRSRYPAERLNELAAEREMRWRDHPPLTWSRFSREDQYLSEAVAHVQRRNQNWATGQILAARHENLILERYYAPVLDTPSYVSPNGHRWSEAQRAEAHGLTGPGFMIYDSDALPYPVFTWSPSVWWTLVAGAVMVALRWLLRSATAPM